MKFFRLGEAGLVAVCLLLCLQGASQTSSGRFANSGAVFIRLHSGKYIQLTVLSDHVLRIRERLDSVFKPSLLERYEIVKHTWPATNFTRKDSADVVTLRTSGFLFKLNTQTGKMELENARAQVLVKGMRISLGDQSQLCKNLKASLKNLFKDESASSGHIIGEKTDVTGSGSVPGHSLLDAETPADFLSFSLEDGERLYGLGSASRRHLQHRGEAVRIWAKYQQSEAPSPFLMSTRGWGFLNGNTRREFFDLGKFSRDSIHVLQSGGEADFYLFAAKDMPSVLEQYTSLTGRPFLLPEWAYGLAFGSNTTENQLNILEDALHFRQEKIPCDLYWIEPQWMKTNYDYSTSQTWDSQKFVAGLPWKWASSDTRRTLFIQRLHDMGFKLALWLCLDPDLSVMEEDRIANEAGRAQSGREHWFDHLTKLIDDGVQGFKLDPSRIMDEHPGRPYYNGLTDEEMHMPTQVLSPKQLLVTCRSHTGLRPFQHYCGGFTGIHHWSASTTGDNGGSGAALYDVLNHAMTGHMNVSCDVLEQVYPLAQGIHMGFLLPWTQINSWAYIFHPWFFSPEDKAMLKYYDCLRYSLEPYIYSAALQGATSGMPIARPLPLVYPMDEHVADLVNEYMLGDNLLVGAFTRQIYLPAGEWTDYWSGKVYSGNQMIVYPVPKNRGGPLFIRAGAIIPMMPEQQFIGEKKKDSLILKVFPKGNSSFSLLEDDGQSFKYEEGQYARTKISVTEAGRQLTVNVAPQIGKYENSPEARTYTLLVKTPKPKEIYFGHRKVKATAWKYTGTASILEYTFSCTSAQGASILISR